MPLTEATLFQKLSAYWGISGIILLFFYAIERMSGVIKHSFSQPLAWYHGLFLLFWLALMIYFEGVKGFHQNFSPRVAARAKYLAQQPVPSHFYWLAPLFCFGYFHATQSRRLKSTLLTLMIILFVIGVGHAPQPWRGLIDIGVVVGLLIGILSTLYFAKEAFTNHQFAISPETPDQP